MGKTHFQGFHVIHLNRKDLWRKKNFELISGIPIRVGSKYRTFSPGILWVLLCCTTSGKLIESWFLNPVAIFSGYTLIWRTIPISIKLFFPRSKRNFKMYFTTMLLSSPAKLDSFSAQRSISTRYDWFYPRFKRNEKIFLSVVMLQYFAFEKLTESRFLINIPWLNSYSTRNLDSAWLFFSLKRYSYVLFKFFDR